MKPAALFLIGQSLTLGLALAFLIVPGMALFLDVFGAENLPYVYLIVAALGAVVSYSLTALQKTFGLFHLAIGSTLIVALAILACWELLFVNGRDWVAYGVLVLFALEVQLGFVFIGAQAGRAFDVQELKQVFSRIVAGFVLGFMAGGFAGAAFSRQGWDAVHLLLASAGMAIVMATLMIGARRYVPEPVGAPGDLSDGPSDNKHPSLRRILRDPLIRVVFVYQMLSAIGTQLIEYLLYDRAAARYSGTQELAAFLGGYSALLNFVDLLVLVAFGGFLMSRYGLRYGLAANPIAVTGLVVAAAVVALASGPDSTLFFLLVAAARIADVTLTDASARTSINATFAALPMGQRLAAQVGVEGAGVPLALGLTAVLILVINALPGSTINEVTAAAFVICVFWSISAWRVYRRYQAAIVAAARRRMLDGEVVDLNEPTTRTAVLSLLASLDPRDAAIGASLLTSANDRETPHLIEAAANNAPLEKQRALLNHLVERSPDLAGRIAIRCLQSGSPGDALDGLRCLGRIGVPLEPTLIAPYLDHPDLRLRAEAIGAGLRSGRAESDAAGLVVAAASRDSDDRRLAAMAIAAARWSPSLELLTALLGDAEEDVREEAAAAVAALNDAQRVEMLRMPMPAREKIRFVRACRSRTSPEFCRAVAGEISKDDALRPELVRLLGVAGWRAKEERDAIDGMMRREVERISAVRRWADRIGVGSPHSEAIARILRALIQEAHQSGRQLTELLCLLYDRRLIARTSRVLQDLTPGDKGLAIESLDVILASNSRATIIAALRTAFLRTEPESGRRKSQSRGIDEGLRALAADCHWAIRSDWLLACTIVAMRDAGISTEEIAAIRPLGPVSAELIPAAPQ